MSRVILFSVVLLLSCLLILQFSLSQEENIKISIKRFAPKELIDRADFVNEIVDVKHPKKIPTTKGIQY